MQFTTEEGPLEIAVDRMVVAGWTGRDAAGVQHHIEELTALGVAPPSQVPLYYQVSGQMLTQVAVLTVVGAQTSGEAEPLLVQSGGELWLGLGSDHTDRALEATSVALSKQICGKPVAKELWRFADVADRLDTLELRAWIMEDGAWTPYQEGTLAAIRPLGDLLAGADLGDPGVMLCGTLPAIGGVRAASAFKASLTDPATGRQLSMEYKIITLPEVA
ncbi:DUF2848 domain-containing protein [Pseudaestuariivita sp.]|uniref:DUF2848 domain-containing protein n=1 Tax=Pseudaestuariivita sp. TaxID=2211669 RepID=UPI0040587508